jgi:periplasmic divalent cation tolerance protein
VTPLGEGQASDNCKCLNQPIQCYDLYPMPELLMVITTVPDRAIGLSLSNGLLEQKLIACAQLLPALTSIYEWQGKVCEATEHLLFLKTTKDKYQQVETYLQAQHPYDEPEIIALPIVLASAGYGQWIESIVQGES